MLQQQPIYLLPTVGYWNAYDEHRMLVPSSPAVDIVCDVGKLAGCHPCGRCWYLSSADSGQVMEASMVTAITNGCCLTGTPTTFLTELNR